MNEHDANETRPALEQQLVAEFRSLIDSTAVGQPFAVSPSDDVCSILELYIPHLLRTRYPLWKHESLDGFFFAQALRTDVDSLQLVGTCILITDQTMAPFHAEFELSGTRIGAYSIDLGEPGSGPLGISGPDYGSHRAGSLLVRLLDRVDSVQWSYQVSGGSHVEEQARG